MQSLINNKKIKKTNMLLLKREKFIYSLMSLILLFLVFSYAFQLLSSVSKIYAIKNGEQELVKMISQNAEFESEYYVLKENIENNFSKSLVLAKNIDYVDSSFNKLVFVKN